MQVNTWDATTSLIDRRDDEYMINRRSARARDM